MPQYRVLKRSFIDNHLRDEGDVVSYDGFPSDNLEPMDDEGRAKQKEGAKAAKAALLQMIRDTQPLGQSVDAQAISAAIAQAVADGIAQAKG